MRARAARIAKGNDGERQVGVLLDVLDGAGWVVLNDRYKSPRSSANLDHVVIGPPGVFVIDAKNWTGRLSLDERGLACRGYRKDEELRAAGADAELVRQHAEQVVPGLPVTGVLAFVQDPGLEAPVDHGGAVLLHVAQLLVWLTSLPHLLSSQQVHQVASSLDTALPPRSERRPPRLSVDDVVRARMYAPPAQSASGPRARSVSASRPPAARRVRSAVLRPLARATAVCVLFLLLIAIMPAAVQAVSPFVEARLRDALTPRPTTSSCGVQVLGTCPTMPASGVGAAPAGR